MQMKSRRKFLPPVLLGLDGGDREADPLDPEYYSGARLRLLSGLDRDRYLESFGRDNLHRRPSPGSRDRSAWDRISGRLEGRRVVALGRRAARATGASDIWFRWTVAGGIVVSSMPHPSGLNRWWNDPRNMDTAGRFVRTLLAPCIHVEGPDGSGKSTLVPRLANRLNLRGVQTQGPPRSWSECLGRVERRIIPGVVCDRSSGLVSELVYGPVLRGETLGKEEWIWDLVKAVRGSVVFVYCRPPIDSMQMDFRPDEDPVHVGGVVARYGRIVDRYDEVMDRIEAIGGTVVRYDRTVMGFEELIECVE